MDATNVALEKWPLDRIPEGSISDMDALEERFASMRLYKGEPIVDRKLMDKNSSDSVKISEGYRVTSIRVSAESAVSGLIQPGDRVDIIGFFRAGGDISTTSTRAILRNVRVFSVDSATSRVTDAEGQSYNAKTLSLLVKQNQIEPLMLAMQLGQLRLALRHPDDPIDATSNPATIDSLFNGAGEDADDPRPTKPEPKSNDNSFLSLLQNAADPTQLVSAEPEFKMVVHSPNGADVFTWQDRNELPDGVSMNGLGQPTVVAPTEASDEDNDQDTTDDSSDESDNEDADSEEDEEDSSKESDEELES